ncbi:hypothetical protein E2C01_074622 [Portunus trituberculatus]|uniref:Uncharacterized protein n=1 Tax=Portunus trituberculatus TaxID=210409 RepID=A0A5B7IGS2_PORTR|nr:hypothetical protein [Portunus trituberculatus]
MTFQLRQTQHEEKKEEEEEEEEEEEDMVSSGSVGGGSGSVGKREEWRGDAVGVRRYREDKGWLIGGEGATGRCLCPQITRDAWMTSEGVRGSLVY